MRTRSIISVFFIFATICLVSACKQKAPEAPKSEVTAEDVKKEAKEAADTAERYAIQKKEEYQKDAEERLAGLEKQIDALNAKIGTLGDKAQLEMKETLKELQAKREAVRKKLDELREPTEMAWKDIKSGIEAAMEELAAAYQKAASRFQETEGGEKK